MVVLRVAAACWRLALGVKLSSRGRVLFRQQRVGQYGRVFELLKFRSLRVNDDSDVRWSVAGDDRQTPFGRWMRRFSLDELPQLWNVLRGDMSLVGPRPERPHFVEAVQRRGAGLRRPAPPAGRDSPAGPRSTGCAATRRSPSGRATTTTTSTTGRCCGDLSILVATVAAVVRDGRSKPSA